MINVFIKTERQQQWLERLATVENDFKGRSQAIDEQSTFPKENIKQLIELGYTSSTLPASYGGGDLNVYDLVLLQETLASYDASTALSIGWGLALIGDLYDKKPWPDNVLNDFSKEVLNGALINRIASEAATGSPTRGGRPVTTAVKQNDTWVINGRKTFATAAPVLTHFVTSVWIEEKGKIGFFLLPRDAEGLSIKETWDVMSMRGTASHDLVLENVVVDAEALVEVPQKPRGAVINGWMLHIPACYLGIAQAARDYVVNFAKTYTPNSLDGPISELPNVQRVIGEIDLALSEARHIIYNVASIYDDETRRSSLSNEIGIVKHAVTNKAITIVDKAMRIVGAQSLQRSNPLQRYYRDVRAGLHNPPMDDMTINNLAQAAIRST